MPQIVRTYLTRTLNSAVNLYPQNKRWWPRLRVSRLFVGKAFWLWIGFVVISMLVRLTVRDRILGISTLFYATPYPALMLVAGFVAVVQLLLGRWRHCLVCCAAAILCFVLWFGTCYYRNVPSTDKADVTVTLWNAMRGRGSKNRMFDAIFRDTSDIIALVEAGADRVSAEEWASELPGRDVRKLSGGMMIMINGKILSSQYTSMDRRGRFNVLDVIVRESTYTVILTDLHSDPRYDKSVTFARLNKLIAENQRYPLIVMGDFNTPLESVMFESLRHQGLAHAFEVAGNGFAETWALVYLPLMYNLPLLSLDHIWSSGELRPLQTQLRTSRASDHKVVVANYQWAEVP